VNLTDRSQPMLVDFIDPKKYAYLPNTAGCFTGEEAVRTLRLAREAGGWTLVKLEVLGEKKLLYPDMIETLRATEMLSKDGFQVMGMAALSAFEFANIDLGHEAYRVTVMSETGGPVRTSLGMVVDTAPFEAPPDTLMVLGQIVPQPPSPGLRSFLTRCAAESRRVAGVCTGAFALADAGLLDGRSATTHWAHARRLQQLHPAVRVDEDRIFIADGKFWTSAGMSAAIDLTLALIEDDHGAEISRSVARNLVVYHRRPGGQSQFSALLELEPRSDRVRRARRRGRRPSESWGRAHRPGTA